MAGDRRSLPETQGSRRLFAARACVPASGRSREGRYQPPALGRPSWRGQRLSSPDHTRSRSVSSPDEDASEKCGDLAGAACKNSTAKLVVYPVGAFAAWSCIGHVSLAWVTRRGQRGTCYHPRRMRAAQIGLIGTLTGRLTPPGRASLVVRIAADGSSRRSAIATLVLNECEGLPLSRPLPRSADLSQQAGMQSFDRTVSFLGPGRRVIALAVSSGAQSRPAW